MLSTRPMCFFGTEEFAQGLYNSVENRYTRDTKLAAFLFQLLKKDWVDQREEDDARIDGNMFHCPAKLHLVANERINMLSHRNSVELCTDRLSDNVEGFPG